MREHEAERPRTPRLWHSWLKRISNAATHLSAATLLASGMASSLAARKHGGRHDDGGDRDRSEKDRGSGNDRDQEDKHGNDAKEDRSLHRDHAHKSDGDGHGGHGHRGGAHERQVDESSDVDAAAKKTATATPTATATATPTGGGGGGGGGKNHGGGKGDGGNDKGDGGGNDKGNAGSGLFDRPLATKARRRANDFDNADRDDDDHRTVVDVDPEGESVYGTDSVTFSTGPDGIDIQTDNISYTALPTPTPEPLPALELPTREPGFPFGEDFPFGNSTVVVNPTAPEAADPGDTGSAPAPRAEPIPAADASAPTSSDGGDNTMDFSS